jgi:hypothetical protein
LSGRRNGDNHATGERLRKTPHVGMLCPNTEFDARDELRTGGLPFDNLSFSVEVH